MTTVRKESEPLGDNELVIEVIEDNPASNRVALTLMSKGPQGEIAIGRANLGQVFRKQTRPQAEALVDTILGYLSKGEGPAPTPIEAQIKARVTGVPIPVPVKARGPEGQTGAGIELDHLTRRDFAEILRKLADQIETNDPAVTLQQLDIEPIRGGGQTIALRAVRR